MDGVQIIGVDGEERVAYRNDLLMILGVLIYGEQLLVDPGDRAGGRILRRVFFEECLFACRHRLLLDALQENAIFAFRIDIWLVSFCEKRQATKQRGQHRQRGSQTARSTLVDHPHGSSPGFRMKSLPTLGTRLRTLVLFWFAEAYSRTVVTQPITVSIAPVWLLRPFTDAGTAWFPRPKWREAGYWICHRPAAASPAQRMVTDWPPTVTLTGFDAWSAPLITSPGAALSSVGPKPVLKISSTFAGACGRGGGIAGNTRACSIDDGAVRRPDGQHKPRLLEQSWKKCLQGGGNAIGHPTGVGHAHRNCAGVAICGKQRVNLRRAHVIEEGRFLIDLHTDVLQFRGKIAGH